MSYDDNTPVQPPVPPRRRMQIHLSTAENVGRLFEQDWVILIGCKDGETHFVPWIGENTDQTALAEWLTLLSGERRRRQTDTDQVTKGPST